MIAEKRRLNASVNTGSMADIAFLLLVFFLVTTTIATDQGLLMRLPPPGEPPTAEFHERNVLNLLVNSEGELLADGESVRWQDVSALVKEFIANPHHSPSLAESPKKAIVSIQSARGTSYEDYILLLDSIKQSYHELRAESLGLSLEAYIRLNPKEPRDLSQLKQSKEEYPMQISEAEPIDVK